MSHAIGIDLGGSSIKMVGVSLAGTTLAQSNINFDAAARMDWAAKIKESARRLQREIETQWSGSGARAATTTGATPAPLRIGVSAPGLAAGDGRSIAYMPERLQGLEGLDWTSFLGASSPVPVLNDAHAALLGEAWLGAATSFQNVILLTLGTGVGGAAIVDGRLLRGQIGRAGHLGHMSLDPDGAPDCTGAPGSLEVAIGNCTIEARTRGRFHSTHDLVNAHLKGDAEATAVWLKSVKALAAAICSLVNILDSEAVIIGGGIAGSGAALFEPLQTFLDAMEWRPGNHRVRIIPAQLGEMAGAVGAARNALDQTSKEVATEMGSREIRG
jgi:glucokinase